MASGSVQMGDTDKNRSGKFVYNIIFFLNGMWCIRQGCYVLNKVKKEDLIICVNYVSFKKMLEKFFRKRFSRFNFITFLKPNKQ